MLAEIIKEVQQTGNLGPIARTIANLHVMDFFKYVTGKGKSNTGRFAEIDFMDLTVEWREYSKNPNCKTCLNSNIVDRGSH